MLIGFFQVYQGIEFGRLWTLPLDLFLKKFLKPVCKLETIPLYLTVAIHPEKPKNGTINKKKLKYRYMMYFVILVKEEGKLYLVCLFNKCNFAFH